MKFKLLLPALLLALALTGPASAQTSGRISGTLDIAAGYTVTNGTSAVTSNTALTVRPKQDLGVLFMVTAAGTGTSNCVCNIQVSPDGTNYSTVSFLSVNTTLNGTTAVAQYTNFPASSLIGIKTIRFSGITTTQTNGVTVSGVKYGFFY